MEQLAPACSSPASVGAGSPSFALPSGLLRAAYHHLGLLRLPGSGRNRIGLPITAFMPRTILMKTRCSARCGARLKRFCPVQAPLVAAMDDSLLRKTGRKVSGARYLRDPMSSAPFIAELCPGPAGVAGLGGRARRVGRGRAAHPGRFFSKPPCAVKPRKNAPDQQWEVYEQERA